MPLVMGKELLARALREGYALAAFNIATLEMVPPLLAAAEEERAPVILQFNPGNLEHVGLEYASAAVQKVSQKATVPVVLHLDHGTGLEQSVRCLQAGFTSLMYDGTAESLERNAAVTRQICDMAHAVGIPVEGELGRLAGREADVTVSEEEASLTDPQEARWYVQETGVDSLAVAAGNAHGMTRRQAKLDLKRIERIREQVGIPLVLHGGSGIPDATVREAIARGVCKFNVATQLNRNFLEALTTMTRERPEETDLRLFLARARQGVKEAAQSKLRLFGAAGKA